MTTHPFFTPISDEAQQGSRSVENYSLKALEMLIIVLH
jgi:hypothetical protein